MNSHLNSVFISLSTRMNVYFIHRGNLHITSDCLTFLMTFHITFHSRPVNYFASVPLYE